jgi:hypothetical protein
LQADGGDAPPEMWERSSPVHQEIGDRWLPLGGLTQKGS